MTATHRPVTLDDLDRDELLRLIRDGIILWSEADLIWAQWRVACDRWQAAWTAYGQAVKTTSEARDTAIAAGVAFGDALRALASARKLATLRRAHRVAEQRLIAAHAAEVRAKAKADRIERRQQALLARHKAMRGDSDAA
jgi:hypothetical protein